MYFFAVKVGRILLRIISVNFMYIPVRILECSKERTLNTWNKNAGEVISMT